MKLKIFICWPVNNCTARWTFVEIKIVKADRTIFLLFQLIIRLWRLNRFITTISPYSSDDGTCNTCGGEHYHNILFMESHNRLLMFSSKNFTVQLLYITLFKSKYTLYAITICIITEKGNEGWFNSGEQTNFLWFQILQWTVSLQPAWGKLENYLIE